MLKPLFSLVSMLIIASSLLAQNETKLSNPIKNLGDEVIYINQSRVVAVSGNKSIGGLFYSSLNLNTSITETNEISQAGGVQGAGNMMCYSVQDHFVFEVYQFMERADIRFRIVKRDLISMKEIGSAWLTESQPMTMISYPQIIIEGDKIAVSVGGRSIRLNSDLEGIQSVAVKRLDDNCILMVSNFEKDGSVVFVNVDRFDSNIKGFTVVEQSGEQHSFKPEMESSVELSKAKIFYDSKSELLHAVIISTNKEFVQRHFSWNMSGELQNNCSTLFKVRDLVGEDPKVKELFDFYGVSLDGNQDDALNGFENTSGSIEKLDNGNFVVCFSLLGRNNSRLSTKLNLLRNSSFVYEVNSDCELLWSKIIVRENTILDNQIVGEFRGDKIYFLSKEYKSSIKNQEYVFESKVAKPMNAKNVSSVFTNLDLEDQNYTISVIKDSGLGEKDEFFSAQILDGLVLKKFLSPKRKVRYSVTEINN